MPRGLSNAISETTENVQEVTDAESKGNTSNAPEIGVVAELVKDFFTKTIVDFILFKGVMVASGTVLTESVMRSYINVPMFIPVGSLGDKCYIAVVIPSNTEKPNLPEKLEGSVFVKSVPLGYSFTPYVAVYLKEVSHDDPLWLALKDNDIFVLIG